GDADAGLDAGPQPFHRISLAGQQSRAPPELSRRASENGARPDLCGRHAGVGGPASGKSVAADRVRAGFRSVKLGFVGSLTRPGGNITGFSTFEYPIGGKWLELLKDTAPGRTRVAVLLDPDNPSQVAYLQGVETAAPTFGVQLMRADVRNAADIERAINDFAEQPNGALIVT